MIKNGRPVVGVVYVPVQDKLYYGVSGTGVEPVKVNAREAAQEADLTVVMSPSRPSTDLEDYLKDIKVAEAMPVGSSLTMLGKRQISPSPFFSGSRCFS